MEPGLQVDEATRGGVVVPLIDRRHMMRNNGEGSMVSHRGRPGFRTTVLADVRRLRASSDESNEPSSSFGALLTVARQCWASDDYFGVLLYRIRTALRERQIPLVPWMLHRVCVAGFGIRIGNDVAIGGGLHLPYGNVTIEGPTRIGQGVTIGPWASLGSRRWGEDGPSVGDDVVIGTHCNILGPFTIGARSVIDAGTALTGDVAPAIGGNAVGRDRDPVGQPATPQAQPPLGRALRADGVAFAASRGEAFAFPSRAGEWRNVLRLLVQSGDYMAIAAYRVRMWLHAAHVPILPTLLKKVSIAFFKVHIGDRVRMDIGVYIPHGDVVIDGITSIGSGVIIAPWATVGLRAGSDVGPTIESGVFVGTHASVLGDVHVGRASQIGASAVVVEDVASHTVVAGVPARVIAENIEGRLEQHVRKMQSE